MLDELSGLRCIHDEELTPERMADLQKTVDSLRARGARTNSEFAERNQ